MIQIQIVIGVIIVLIVVGVLKAMSASDSIILTILGFHLPVLFGGVAGGVVAGFFAPPLIRVACKK